jgi:hypothetical protein
MSTLELVDLPTEVLAQIGEVPLPKFCRSLALMLCSGSRMLLVHQQSASNMQDDSSRREEAILIL